jgi:hypothetical protein
MYLQTNSHCATYIFSAERNFKNSYVIALEII